MSLEFWNGDVVVFVWIQFIFMDSIEAQTQMLFINRFCHHVKIIMFRRRSMLKKKVQWLSMFQCLTLKLNRIGSIRCACFQTLLFLNTFELKSPVSIHVW